MDADTTKIRDACRRLADLLDETENASGPWLLVPPAARALRDALTAKLAPQPRLCPYCAAGRHGLCMLWCSTFGTCRCEAAGCAASIGLSPDPASTEGQD